ncbi:hypothetical protein K435DRAFT_972250 [Dendrothele bispora CBS 962.96]|uniref:Uncharacterized protein n=1 Tax=Dendrothele bispora (strain CBS 962.96) TaxID=1314807 RepID=A0A4S8L065_DENBC|nr:hypothetical protein K435DRAFT_972250 [Dendrothele bispora CBS 962.96]
MDLIYFPFIVRKNYLLMGLIIVLILAKLVTSVAYVILGFAQRLDTAEKLKHVKGLSMTVNVLAATGDVVISAAICTMLSASEMALPGAIMLLTVSFSYFQIPFAISLSISLSDDSTPTPSSPLSTLVDEFKPVEQPRSLLENHILPLLNRPGAGRARDIMSAHQERTNPNTQIQVQIDTIIDYNNGSAEVTKEVNDDPERQSSTQLLNDKSQGL